MRPHIIENLISRQDAQKVIDFIDGGDSFFNYGINNLVRYLRYGKDIHFTEDDKSLLPAEIKDILNKCSQDIIAHAKSIFSVDQSYLTQAWLVKRLPGNIHGLHDDYEHGDEHLQFGGVIYLNDNGENGGGEIYFPKINYEYKPKGLDVIIFNSREKLYTHGVKMVNSNRYSIAFWTTGDKSYELEV